jgi:hypothetical protein
MKLFYKNAMHSFNSIHELFDFLDTMDMTCPIVQEYYAEFQQIRAMMEETKKVQLEIMLDLFDYALNNLKSEDHESGYK